ncbi:MAG: tetratricopeptide repeat protein [Planctomycetota bacterium]|jgi:tetratricopeptide (TPR) repeat protein
MRKLTPILTLAVAITLVGCAGQQEFTRGRRLYELQQYEEAVKSLEEAVAKDPRNREYADLLEKVKKVASRSEYNRGLLLYGKNQLTLALASLEAAVAYDPDFEDARHVYQLVKKRRDIIATVVSDIPALLSEGRPDEALDKIKEVEPYRSDFPRIRQLKTQALGNSTVLHAKRGAVALQEGRFEEARTEFQIALNRTPGYSPAVDGLSKANAQLKAAALVADGRALLAAGAYAGAYARFEEALRVVPGHEGATEALKQTAVAWARGLRDDAKVLEGAGDFDSLAEALRKYERAGQLSALSPETTEKIEALKKAIAGEFRQRGQQYEELGDDYLGLSLINYQMSLYCDGGQQELSRRIASLKEAFDDRRAFYIDIRSDVDSSVGTSFGRQLAQLLKKAVIESGIKDLYVVAPFPVVSDSAALAQQRGLAGRRMTIFTSLIGEDVVVRGEDKPEVVRSSYRVGTRYVPNPDYDAARRKLAEVRARETEASQDLEDLLILLRGTEDPDEREDLLGDIAFQRSIVEDAEDDVTEAERLLAATDRDIEQEVFQPYDYIVYTVTMEAKVEVSLEVADPERGTTRTLEVITGKVEVEDTYNEDVQATDVDGAKVNPKELPTQSEVLAGAREDAGSKAVEWIKKSLNALAMQYYNRAKELEEIGNLEGAAEYYYAFWLTTPDRSSPEAKAAVDYVRRQTHIITPDERAQ